MKNLAGVDQLMEAPLLLVDGTIPGEYWGLCVSWWLWKCPAAGQLGRSKLRHLDHGINVSRDSLPALFVF